MDWTYLRDELHRLGEEVAAEQARVMRLSGHRGSVDLMVVQTLASVALVITAGEAACVAQISAMDEQTRGGAR